VVIGQKAPTRDRSHGPDGDHLVELSCKGKQGRVRATAALCLHP
jgi:hypothetical protein